MIYLKKIKKTKINLVRGLLPKIDIDIHIVDDIIIIDIKVEEEVEADQKNQNKYIYISNL